MAADKEVEMTARVVCDDGIKGASPEDVEHCASASPEHRQGLERFINLSSAINFSAVTLCSWEWFAITFQFALFNGGPASMLYGSILASFGSMAVATSLAEMASIDPVVGAQYRWSASFAPRAPKFWGLMQGWITIFAWIVSTGGVSASIANLIAALAIFNYESYQPERWHITLIMWALILVPFILNLWFRKLLNVFELLGGFFHIIFFIISLVTLVVTAQRSTTHFVFETLTHNVSGWENPVVAWGLGLLTVVSPITGYDAVLHMSDEVKKVRTRVPRSIMIACASNGLQMFAFVICLLFTIGDIDKVTNTPTGLPLIEVYYEATKSKHATNWFVLMPAINLFFNLFNCFASVSRLIWQFAQDKGLPFSTVFAYVHPKLRLPLNALALACAINLLQSIIYIVSITAYNAIISLSALSLTVSYFIPIFFVFLRKIRGPPPLYGPFKLGRRGLFVNISALLYLVFVGIWMPFPQFLPVTGNNMNYAGPVFGAVIVGALLDWMISGRKRFEVPLAPKM